MSFYSDIQVGSKLHDEILAKWDGDTTQEIHSADGCGSMIYWDETVGICLITNQAVLANSRQRTSLAMILSDVHTSSFGEKFDRESFLEVNDLLQKFHVQILENLLTNIPKKP